MITKNFFTKTKEKKIIPPYDSNQVKSQQPIIPMNKVSVDVIKKLQTQPYPQLALATHSTISDALEVYYNEYVRLFNLNQSLNDQLATILLERNSLADQFNQIKKMKSYDDNIRRRRRYASQIERNFHCPMPKCNKGYGSQGSLTHHVRLKHPKFFQTGEYEIYLETYILPKQEIKNQDKNGKSFINLEELEEKVKLKNQQKNQTKNDIVKQAKQQEILSRNTPQVKKIYVVNGSCLKQKKIEIEQKPALNNQNQNLMSQVDQYIALDDYKPNKEEESRLNKNQQLKKRKCNDLENSKNNV